MASAAQLSPAEISWWLFNKNYHGLFDQIPLCIGGPESVKATMGVEEEPENIIVPGQGLRRVKPLPLVAAIGFSGSM